MFHLLLEALLSEYDQYLLIYIFSSLQFLTVLRWAVFEKLDHVSFHSKALFYLHFQSFSSVFVFSNSVLHCTSCPIYKNTLHMHTHIHTFSLSKHTSPFPNAVLVRKLLWHMSRSSCLHRPLQVLCFLKITAWSYIASVPEYILTRITERATPVFQLSFKV